MQELSGDGENGEKETNMQHRPWKSLVVLTAGLALVALAGFSHAEEWGRAHGKQYPKGDAERIIKSLETNSDQFTEVFNKVLDRSKLDGTSREDRLNQQFERALDGLRAKSNRR
jgi:hypothetical protein